MIKHLKNLAKNTEYESLGAVPFGTQLNNSKASFLFMKEIFKTIPNYPDYEVSNLGRVKSLKHGKERILKPFTNASGYLMVSLSDGNYESLKIHRLMAIVFLGYIPNGNKIVVDHINNIKTDNRLSNLQVITHRKNCSKDKWRKGTSSKYTGVSLHKYSNKWRATFYIKRKQIFLGYFKREEEASEAYQNYLKEYNEKTKTKKQRTMD